MACHHDSPEVRRYVDCVDRFSRVVRSSGNLQRGAFLRELEIALIALYESAVRLPDVSPDSSDVSRVSADSYATVAPIAALLGPYDQYQEIFDPSDPQDVKPVQFCLSLDVGEILTDVERGRELANSSDISHNDILWQLRFDFTSHWARHAASALKVVNTLLYSHFLAALDGQDA
jgi:hypothetical protein